jgi:nicotinate-nucleotide adenylyltransferase
VRVGLYGGSFDPIHRGHVEPVLHAMRELGLDRVVFVPAAMPPHKPAGPAASAFHRFAMTALAIAEHDALLVDDFEMARAGTTYTIETLRRFQESLPGAEVVLVLGSDSLASFATWRAWSEIAGTTRIAVLAREPWDRAVTQGAVPEELSRRFAPERATFDDAGAEATILWAGNPPVTISSTWLRGALRAGRPEARSALPAAVERYVTRHGLYREPPAPSSPSTS